MPATHTRRMPPADVLDFEVLTLEPDERAVVSDCRDRIVMWLPRYSDIEHPVFEWWTSNVEAFEVTACDLGHTGPIPVDVIVGRILFAAGRAWDDQAWGEPAKVRVAKWSPDPGARGVFPAIGLAVVGPPDPRP